MAFRLISLTGVGASVCGPIHFSVGAQQGAFVWKNVNAGSSVSNNGSSASGNSVSQGNTVNTVTIAFCNGGIRYSTGAAQTISWVAGGSRDVGTATTNGSTNGNSVNTGSTGNNGAPTTFCNGGIRYSTGAAQTFSWVAGGSRDIGTATTNGSTTVNGNGVNTGNSGTDGASTAGSQMGTTGTSGTAAVTSGKSISGAGIVGIVLGCIAFHLFLLFLFCLMKIKKSEKDDSIEESEFDVEAGVVPEVDTEDVTPTEWVRHVVHEEQATDVVVTTRRSGQATHNGVTFQTQSIRQAALLEVSEAQAVKGLKVVRGPAWNHGDQDGGEGARGELYSNLKENWWVVVWETGKIHAYKLTDLSVAPVREHSTRDL